MGTGSGKSTILEAWASAIMINVCSCTGKLRPWRTSTVIMELTEAVESKATFLVWQDLTVLAQSLRNGPPRKLLNGLNGYVESDRIMAVMGPSGSGKSTFLDALAGRLSRNTIMTGHVLLNGKKGGAAGRDTSYVIQEDYFFGTLSVRETLTYSAQLRLPNEITNIEINKIVEETIIKMGLQDCAENKIGNWHFRGISKGEKRRLGIGIEILTQPRVLFLDEVTSGLDSASAFFVLQVLTKIAHDGRIVVCSIHQPSSHLFDLFDDLLLLSCGETIYFGGAKSAVKFFAEAGFPCPTRRNPSDHFLRCINSDFDKIAAIPRQYSESEPGIQMSSDSQTNLCTEKIKENLMQKYRNSEDWVKMRRRVRDLALIEKDTVNVSSKSNGKRWKQLCILTRRSMVNMCRDMGYYWLRIVFYILVSISVGIMYLNIGVSYSAILARTKCDAFIDGFMICLSVGGLPFFIEEYKVSFYEMIKGHYGEGAFVLSNFISSLPFLVLLSMSSGTIIYYTVKFHPGFSHYTYFCMNIFCCVSIVETCMMVVALAVPNVLMGIGVGTAVIVLMMMASEIFRPIPDLPKFFWRYPMSYISFASWAIEGQYKNDMLGLEFDSPFPGDNTKLKGDQVLQNVFAMELRHSKWWDLFALSCLLFAYKLIFFALLKYKGKLSSILAKLSTFIKSMMWQIHTTNYFPCKS